MGSLGGGEAPVTTLPELKTKCIFYHLDGFAHCHKYELFACCAGNTGSPESSLPPPIQLPHISRDSLTSPCQHVTVSQCHGVTGNAAAPGVGKWNKTGEKSTQINLKT